MFESTTLQPMHIFIAMQCDMTHVITINKKISEPHLRNLIDVFPYGILHQ